MTDVVDKLSDAWWKEANDAQKWKQKFECMGELVELMTGDNTGNKPFPDTIKDSKKANDLLKLLIGWLSTEGHVFTRLHILKAMPALIRSFPKKTIEKYQVTLIETICTKQWGEKKPQFLPLVTPVLLELWGKTDIPLKCDEFKPHLMAAFKHRGVEVRMNVCNFLAKATLFKKKKQMTEFLSDKALPDILKKLAGGDKDKRVKVAGCKALNAIMEMKLKKLNKGMEPVWDEIKDGKRSKKNLEEAKKQWEADKAAWAGKPIPTAAPEEEKEEKKK
eukprot:302163_1